MLTLQQLENHPFNWRRNQPVPSPLKPDFLEFILEGGGRIDGSRLIDILQRAKC